MQPSNLAKAPLCDLVDFVARLSAAKMVAQMLARSGYAVPGHEVMLVALDAYMDVLKAEADQRLAEMREATWGKKGKNHV